MEFGLNRGIQCAKIIILALQTPFFMTFYQIYLGHDCPYGEESIIRTLNKMRLCKELCLLENQKLEAIMVNIKIEIDRILNDNMIFKSNIATIVDTMLDIKQHS